jgi:glucose/arabinose dehydrogenase
VRRALAAVVLPVFLLASPAGASTSRAPLASRAIGVQLVKGGLDFPAAFTFTPSGRIFYGDRFSGQIRIYNPKTGGDHLFYTVTNLATQGEQGLLGIALHPDYPTTPLVYAYATRNVSGSLENQILRIRNEGGTGTLDNVVFSSDTTAGDYHDGGRILFGPDGKLYVVVGESHDASNAQDLTSEAGKVLRMNDDGTAPGSNPFPGKRIWSYGLRNSFGFTFDPETGRLWESEAGPSCNDEINLIKKGRNFGWGPSEDCSLPNPPENTNRDGPNPVLPLAFFTPVITPVGIDFCEACGLTGGSGHLFFGDNNNGNIHEAVLNANRNRIASMTGVYHHSSGILSMETGPDTSIYFSDSTAIYKLVNA